MTGDKQEGMVRYNSCAYLARLSEIQKRLDDGSLGLSAAKPLSNTSIGSRLSLQATRRTGPLTSDDGAEDMRLTADAYNSECRSYKSDRWRR